ncbi:MAG: type II toxin-antitoxin system HicB family antitoxin [Candidatus Aminicenantes bacterium]|nr:type II toxin-antitoxin system HicB family antitoxin [Candidatus Aminicenantes bacterium]
MDKIMKLPLLLEPAEEGGWVVSSPVIPELITEIDHLDEIDDKIKDAVAAAKELYDDMGKDFPGMRS